VTLQGYETVWATGSLKMTKNKCQCTMVYSSFSMHGEVRITLKIVLKKLASGKTTFKTMALKGEYSNGC
jgi:hypothetical protein